MTELLAPVSPGELIDKITILEIKRERIADEVKQVNIAREHDVLSAVAARLVPSGDLDRLKASLKSVNEELWVIEDDIRDCEREGRFDDEFVRLARAVYQTNDRRAELKREINELLGSDLIEEKSYQPY